MNMSEEIRTPYAGDSTRVTCNGEEHWSCEMCTVCRPVLERKLASALKSGDRRQTFEALRELYPLLAYESCCACCGSNEGAQQTMHELFEKLEPLLEK